MIFKFYEILKWDGCDRQYPSGICFSNREAAEEFLEGNKYDTISEHKYIVHDSVADYKENGREALKAKALAKALDEEREALGIYND